MKSVIKHQTLSEGAVILVFTAIITKAIGALFKIPLASELCLGDLGFGYFSAAYDLISPIILIAVSGLPISVSKIISGYSTENSVVKTKNIFQLARKLFFTVGLCLLLLAFVLIFNAFKLSFMFIYSLQICKYLTRMQKVCKTVYYTYRTVFCQIIHVVLREGTNHNTVQHTR